MAFIESSDFAGKYKLSQDTANQTITTRVISEMRDGLIRKIFGATLGNEIIDYIDNPPGIPDPVLDAVINSFSIDSNCGKLLESIGLKNVLLGFIYFQRACDMKLQMQSVGGETKPKTENTTVESNPSAKIIQRYNESVNSVRSIQEYVKENRSNYPDYNGQKFMLNYF